MSLLVSRVYRQLVRLLADSPSRSTGNAAYDGKPSAWFFFDSRLKICVSYVFIYHELKTADFGAVVRYLVKRRPRPSCR